MGQGPVLDILANRGEPMKCGTSIGSPLAAGRCRDRRDVRGERARGTIGANRQATAAISRARRATSAATCGPAPGRPMSAMSMRSSFHQMEDLQASRRCWACGLDADWRPSRSGFFVGNHHERRRTCRFAPVPVVDQTPHGWGDGRVFARSLSVSPRPRRRVGLVNPMPAPNTRALQIAPARSASVHTLA